MTREVVPLGEEHLEEAAALACSRYRLLLEQVPVLPPRYGEVSTLLPLLQDIHEAGPGVAAIDEGRVVGFLAGWVIPSFRGKRATFSPEWGSAAEKEDDRRIFEEMYAVLSATWVGDGYCTHLISTLGDDCDDRRIWHWLGFGMIAIDAVRDLEPTQAPASGIIIRRGEPADIEDAMGLAGALLEHMALPPIFLLHSGQHDRRYFEGWLADPARALWLAYCGTEAVAFMQQGPASEDACTIIRDEKTTSIVGAFTKKPFRASGIGSALLDRALTWARGSGYERSAVDFEPMNPLATRFWLRYFRPVCYTLVRHVDEGEARKREDRHEQR